MYIYRERERKREGERERKRERERKEPHRTQALARISTIDRASLNRYRIASPLSCSMRPKASPARFPRPCDLSLRTFTWSSERDQAAV